MRKQAAVKISHCGGWVLMAHPGGGEMGRHRFVHKYVLCSSSAFALLIIPSSTHADEGSFISFELMAASVASNHLIIMG